MNRLVIGLGFRDEASAQSIGEVVASVIAHAVRPGIAAVLAVPEDKADHPSLVAAANATHLSIKAVAADAMRHADAQVLTRSEQVEKHRGVGSVCEAAALAAAGAGARLIVTRVVSSDRHATAAAAVLEEPTP